MVFQWSSGHNWKLVGTIFSIPSLAFPFTFLQEAFKQWIHIVDEEETLSWIISAHAELWKTINDRRGCSAPTSCPN
jgi:hypothetical protein